MTVWWMSSFLNLNIHCFSLFECNFCSLVSSALLDDLDKELNNYIMRCREWYGWHFPELGKVITDNLAYCKTVRKIGNLDLHQNLNALVLNSA